MHAKLRSDGTNKGANETGVKRFKTFLKHVNYTIERGAAGNAATPEEIKSYLGL